MELVLLSRFVRVIHASQKLAKNSLYGYGANRT